MDTITSKRPLTKGEINGLLDAAGKLRRSGPISRTEAEAKQLEVRRTIAEKLDLPTKGGLYRIIMQTNPKDRTQRMHMQWYKT